MNLINIIELKKKLYQQAEMLEFEIPEIELKESNLEVEELSSCEEALEICFPDTFQRFLLDYDLGNFSVGGLFFGHTGNYLEFLITMNSSTNSNKWWSSDKRPDHFILIGGSDGYVLLLNLQTGEVFAYLRSESHHQSQKVADNIELLICAAGTVHFNRNKDENPKKLGESIARECGASTSSTFWEELLEGIA